MNQQQHLLLLFLNTYLTIPTHIIVKLIEAGGKQ